MSRRGSTTADETHADYRGDETMALHHLTCPSCGAGFDSGTVPHSHGHSAHRDATPRDRDILTCPECRVEFATRPEKDALEAERQRKAAEKID
jgi:hypothetical protein